MKRPPIFYRKFLGMAVVALMILAVLEKLWLGSGINIKAFSQAVLLLCVYPTILEISNRWPKIKLIIKRLIVSVAGKPFSLFKEQAVIYRKAEHKKLAKLIYFCLAFFYFLWDVCWKALFYSMPTAVILGIIGHVFIFFPQGNFYILMVLSLWIVTAWYFNFKARVSIIAGLVFLSMSPLFYIFKTESIADKIAIWAYIFLVMGTAQSLLEYRRLQRG